MMLACQRKREFLFIFVDLPFIYRVHFFEIVPVFPQKVKKKLKKSLSRILLGSLSSSVVT